jgi:hypothetical protein
MIQMSGNRVIAAFVVILMLVLWAPSVGFCASFEVGYSYALDVFERTPSKWQYFGSRITCGIVGSPTEVMQVGGYASYGRYRQRPGPVVCPTEVWGCNAWGHESTIGAVDLGIIFRAIPPLERQAIREFLFVSYAARMMEMKDWYDALADSPVLTIGFGGLIRLGESTRLVVQGGPAFGKDIDSVWLPLSVAIQFGSP